MKHFFALLFFAAAAHCGLVPATTLIRTPSYDSAIVKSDRIGGSFAYSTVEGHAYAAVSPIVQRIREPVGISFTAHQVPLGHIHTPIAVSQPIYAHQQVVAQPILAEHHHLFAQAPVVTAPVFTAPTAPIVSAPVATPPVVSAPVPAIPAAPAAPVADAPATGTVVDADTVAIESA